MVDKKTVDYVANLARIEISEEEKEYLLPQLSKILEYIDKLKELDVSKVEPTRGAFSEENILREDRVKSSEVFKDILKNAPSQYNNLFKIPQVLE
ncbi:MAG: Asp-tRNA(Asn)/Glu-tRNA(Gln) amidotransferase subunit GatC [Candidatus Omnitrophica bacterium]|nr:Asp-tRNA(Asn)/Glu-tRNA(Gln) amidotransferase subunit GatC [Candidatus Omnitrophota bacterium]MCM8823099.1 Asp-tRNA(Asn)/Glu-tRNA(Gln) amidotransferase subunit GatC [Candidatus Omnitrophota bacterium]MCM8826930.1 Asp-tRNA(Asn)/Glu-tRNA(Gln) amidotransferase subunit GatC [Candidatus Omnitrophota bacterium]